MEIGIRLQHHDHDYVERRGGHLLWSHFRASSARSEYRLGAIAAAVALYEERMAEGLDQEAGGVALLVLQRALFACEDLARALNGLLAGPSWQAVVTAKLPALDGIFACVLSDPDSVLRAFALPPDEWLDREHRGQPAVRRALEDLRNRTRRRWTRQLETVASFWLQRRRIAKATMHGFPFIAGDLVREPPGAGVISDHARDDGRHPFAVAVLSSAHHAQARVHTEIFTIPLDRGAVATFQRAGKVAARCAESLGMTQANSIERGYAYGIPLDLLDRLSTGDQRILTALVEEQRDSDAGDSGA
jgi:hypothetical protein